MLFPAENSERRLAEQTPEAAGLSSAHGNLIEHFIAEQRKFVAEQRKLNEERDEKQRKFVAEQRKRDERRDEEQRKRDKRRDEEQRKRDERRDEEQRKFVAEQRKRDEERDEKQRIFFAEQRKRDDEPDEKQRKFVAEQRKRNLEEHRKCDEKNAEELRKLAEKLAEDGPWLQGADSRTIDGLVCTLQDVLGVGATSRVARCVRGSKTFIIKAFHPRKRKAGEEMTDDWLQEYNDIALQALAAEKRFLRTAKDDSLLPEHVRLSDWRPAPRDAVLPSEDVDLGLSDGHVLALCITPECVRLAMPLMAEGRKRIAHDLISALFYAACQGYVHRDVRPDNIMLCKDDPTHAVLIDWGFVVKAGVAVRYSGTGVYASQRVLNERVKSADMDEVSFAVYPCDDACSLVKVLAMQTLAEVYLNAVPSKKPPQEQFDFWKRLFDGGLLWQFKDALDYAEEMKVAGSEEQAVEQCT